MVTYHIKKKTVKSHSQTYYINDGKGGKRPVKKRKNPYTRNQRYRKYDPISMEKALEQFEKRSEKAKALDRSKTSKTVLDEPNDQWGENVGRIDVKGIDTKQEKWEKDWEKAKTIQDEYEKQRKVKEKVINHLEQLGGNHWEKYGKNRIYFNAETLAKIRGYDWERYKTGNISYAKHKGEKISNSEMRRVLSDLSCKLYYDLDDEKFHWNSGVGTGQTHTKKAIKKLKKELNKNK